MDTLSLRTFDSLPRKYKTTLFLIEVELPLRMHVGHDNEISDVQGSQLHKARLAPARVFLFASRPHPERILSNILITSLVLGQGVKGLVIFAQMFDVQ